MKNVHLYIYNQLTQEKEGLIMVSKSIDVRSVLSDILKNSKNTLIVVSRKLCFNGDVKYKTNNIISQEKFMNATIPPFHKLILVWSLSDSTNIEFCTYPDLALPATDLY